MHVAIARLAAVIALPLATAAVPAPDAKATAVDIQRTLGFVPEFLHAFPAWALPGAWEEMKGFQMNPKTALSPKLKELIGLAVSAQVPCDYCIYFHTEAAKAAGATDDEINHALAEAALTRHWSTFLNGLNQDEDAFRRELAQGISYMKKQPTPSVPLRPSPITDMRSARLDIERSWGFVPTFLRAFPDEAIAGAWREWKAIEMNPDAPLDSKSLGLISLAVAAQIPCKYCVIADSMFSKELGGATEREQHEAITMAAMVRHWSTFLNGAQIDTERFQNDVDRIFTKR
jgi:AhpD family alkylhydroperoxidase